MCAIPKLVSAPFFTDIYTCKIWGKSPQRDWLVPFENWSCFQKLFRSGHYSTVSVTIRFINKDMSVEKVFVFYFWPKIDGLFLQIFCFCFYPTFSFSSRFRVCIQTDTSFMRELWTGLTTDPQYVLIASIKSQSAMGFITTLGQNSLNVNFKHFINDGLFSKSLISRNKSESAIKNWLKYVATDFQQLFNILTVCFHHTNMSTKKFGFILPLLSTKNWHITVLLLRFVVA